MAQAGTGTARPAPTAGARRDHIHPPSSTASILCWSPRCFCRTLPRIITTAVHAHVHAHADHCPVCCTLRAVPSDAVDVSPDPATLPRPASRQPPGGSPTQTQRQRRSEEAKPRRARCPTAVHATHGPAAVAGFSTRRLAQIPQPQSPVFRSADGGASVDVACPVPLRRHFVPLTPVGP